MRTVQFVWTLLFYYSVFAESPVTGLTHGTQYDEEDIESVCSHLLKKLHDIFDRPEILHLPSEPWKNYPSRYRRRFTRPTGR
ncbi:hypothetical protein SprV_0401528800 [Sparganum proliferum]